jgi:hypothetical protein
LLKFFPKHFFKRKMKEQQRRGEGTWGGRLGGVLIRGAGPMAEAAFKLLSLSSWYIRSLSASGNCKKFCIARRFTSNDWEAVLGSSSFRRISESKPYRE